jgi:transcriptional regulator with XRE-family HTH domain
MARPSSSPKGQPKADPATVLTKALLRAAQLLNLSSAALARILGVSEASVSRLFSGNRQIDPHSKEGELALLLVRVYRSLDALVGTDAAQRKRWMESDNGALNGRPIELIEGAEGLVSVVSYLDAMRAPA